MWYFVRDEDRYDDKLLHCTISLKEAKCFGATKEQKEEKHIKMNVLITIIHERWDHASTNELKNIVKGNDSMVEDGITAGDIDTYGMKKRAFLFWMC